jgi:hypothetical protein
MVTNMCWLPYLQNYITGNTPYGTGNATHTGNVIFKWDIIGTSAAKAGSPYPKRTLPVLLRNTAYYTSKVSFLMTLSVSIISLWVERLLGVTIPALELRERHLVLKKLLCS